MRSGAVIGPEGIPAAGRAGIVRQEPSAAGSNP